MPLGFESVSHGTIAFGFFHIRIDMLLLERLFFFADRFCRAVAELAKRGAGTELCMDGWRIDHPARIGNLHGAIRGTDLSGFLGAAYRKHPFPACPEEFKQDPDGWQHKEWAAGLIADYGSPESIQLRSDPGAQGVSIGGYVFDRKGFDSLVAYVDRGGYPRWKDEVRPLYVREMMETLERLERVEDFPT
jgi:hypothetical protein